MSEFCTAARSLMTSYPHDVPTFTDAAAVMASVMGWTNDNSRLVPVLRLATADELAEFRRRYPGYNLRVNEIMRLIAAESER